MKIPKQYLALLFIPLFFTLGGCAPTYYQLKSTDKNVDYYQGKEVSYRDDNDFSSSVSFEDQDASNFVFYITVENASDKDITIYPDSFYAEQLDENKVPIESRNGDKFFAINPEKRIDYLNSELKRRSDWHSVASGLNLTFALINVAADLSDSRSHHKAWHVSNDIAVWANNQVNEEIDYANSKKDIKSKSEFWKNEVLRKTTLFPKDQIGGLVFVPFNRKAKYIRLVIPIAQNEHVYLFKKVAVN